MSEVFREKARTAAIEEDFAVFYYTELPQFTNTFPWELINLVPNLNGFRVYLGPNFEIIGL